MPGTVPAVLARLLGAGDPAAREDAWSQFLTAYNRILLHVARSLRGDHDAVMDRYARLLEQLRAEDFRRLRRFVADGRSEFTTWLVVVAQRVCLDHHRHYYGRKRSDAHAQESGADEEFAARRRLVDLVGVEVDLSTLRDTGSPDQDEILRVGEIYGALEALLAELEPRDRLLIKLRFEDELPVPEIVDLLGLATRFQVYRRLSIVLQLLRAQLQRKGITDPRV